MLFLAQQKNVLHYSQNFPAGLQIFLLELRKDWDLFSETNLSNTAGTFETRSRSPSSFSSTFFVGFFFKNGRATPIRNSAVLCNCTWTEDLHSQFLLAPFVNRGCIAASFATYTR